MSEVIKKRLLVVSNLPSDNTRRLADSVVLGASHEDIENVTVQHLETTAASAKEILASDGLILGTTENFGYMSGLMKDFLERIYYPCLDEHKASLMPCTFALATTVKGQKHRLNVLSPDCAGTPSALH